jgi:DNA polymerase III subunit epsilon
VPARRGGLERRLVLGVLALFAVPTVVAGAVLLLLQSRGALADSSGLMVALVVGGMILVAYLAFVAHGLGRGLVRTIRDIGHGAELIATANPDHRLEVRTGDELEDLAEDINRLADRLSEARRGLASEAARTARDLADEQARLVAIVEHLDEGVVAVTAEGRISLANRVASELLAADTPLLGRSLLELVEPDPLADLLASVRAGEPVAGRITVRTALGPIEARITPLVHAGGAVYGLILALRDPAESGTRASSRAGASSPTLAGAGFVSGEGTAEPFPERPFLYDFSYFDAVARTVGADDRSRRLADLAFVVLDTETTGLRPREGDRVVSLAAVIVRGGVVRAQEAFDALVRPARPIPAASTRFHGITDAMVAAAPLIDEVLPAFRRFAADCPLVGHEIAFDLDFLDAEARRLGLPPLGAGRAILDSRLISHLVHGPGISHSLEAVSARLGVAIRARHSALGDALATAEIFARLLDLLARRGISTLGDLLEALRKTPRV